MMKAHKPPEITVHTVGDESVNVWHPDQESVGFCISCADGGWLPGTFDSVEAALRGAELCFEDEYKFVTEIQQPINHFDKQNRQITIEDMS